MALHTLVKTRATDSGRFTELIERSLRRSCNSVLPMAEQDWFRVSSIGGVCPREEVLCSRNGVVRQDNISPDLGMVFEMGHAIHWVMQNRVMAGLGLIGKWRCTWCGEEYGSFESELVARPEECLRCGAVADEKPRVSGRPDAGIRADAFFYVEQWIGNNEYRIGGHPDGFFVDGDSQDFSKEDVFLLEFKSASTRSYYKYKKAPDFMHVVQAQVYMWLTGYRRAKIIYIDKGTFGMGAMAVHDLDYDAETIVIVKQAIVDMRKGISGGKVPERTLCVTQGCKKAAACQVSEVCFTT